ncbi:hypothetical protein FJW07_13995 [Mesorhizobium sp. B3-1-9]|uniref:phage regulatory CII family protein n=1 Tax=Mesorhizobium sp. B3-1-9 TaxID=2589892 RepID=UPI0011298DE9|nr:phage regulatory CII family protein [Mesorhizobium sp. B3-1-9]TPI39288.1 hypothetical protein FJW07_13995 [Mesorhizobium sp. B3-1-9]
MTTARVLRIKSAQNQLIAACGGLDDSADISHFGRSTVGRWADLGDPTLMPLGALLALEAHCGHPIVTAALAEVNNRRLAEPEAEAVSQGNVMARHADAIIHAGELMAAGAAAFADGKVTPNEAVTIDRAAAQLERGLSEYRKALAGVRAAGGLKVVGE